MNKQDKIYTNEKISEKKDLSFRKCIIATH
jgi:hypothetical protein